MTDPAMSVKPQWVKSKNKKSLFKVGQCKQCNISSHLIWVLVADKVKRKQDQDPVSIKTSFPGMGIPMLKIKRSQDRLIFNIEIPILARQHLYIWDAPLGIIIKPIMHDHVANLLQIRHSFQPLSQCEVTHLCRLQLPGQRQHHNLQDKVR